MLTRRHLTRPEMTRRRGAAAWVHGCNPRARMARLEGRASSLRQVEHGAISEHCACDNNGRTRQCLVRLEGPCVLQALDAALVLLELGAQLRKTCSRGRHAKTGAVPLLGCETRRWQVRERLVATDHSTPAAAVTAEASQLPRSIPLRAATHGRAWTPGAGTCRSPAPRCRRASSCGARCLTRRRARRRRRLPRPPLQLSA